MLSYKEQLIHPNWIKKQKEILERDHYACIICGETEHTLEIHHLCYFPDTLNWEYDNELLQTVCKKHHEQLTFDLPKLSGLIALEALKGNIDLNQLYELIKNIDFLNSNK